MNEGKQVQCPWCGETTTPSVRPIQLRDGAAVSLERRCTRCNRILAAYLKGEGNFLPKIRVFESP